MVPAGAEGDTDGKGRLEVVTAGMVTQFQAQMQSGNRLDHNASTPTPAVPVLAIAQDIVTKQGEPRSAEGPETQIQHTLSGPRFHGKYCIETHTQSFARTMDRAQHNGLFTPDSLFVPSGEAPGHARRMA